MSNSAGVGRFTLAGVLEGFYGPPWSWNDRADVMRACVPAGLPWYVWAPKDDPLHRKNWSEPFPDGHLNGFRSLLEIDGLKLGVAIGPGLSMDTADPVQRALLLDKISPVVELGARMVLLAFDDLPSVAGAGARHGELATWVRDRLPDGTSIVFVPTDYAGCSRTPYLDELAATLPGDVLVGWTGSHVVPERITREQALGYSSAVGHRRLAVWDNHPVNDAVLADRLFLSLAPDRDPSLADVCDGYLANAGVQPHLSIPALRAAGAWVSGADPAAELTVALAEMDLGLLAEACDPHVANTLVAGGDLDAIAAWFEPFRALTISGPAADEAAEWVGQARREAEVALAAVGLLRAEPGQAEAIGTLLRVMSGWPRIRRNTVTVFGSRLSLSPAVAVHDNGRWSLSPAALTENENAVDTLCRAALQRHMQG